MKLILKNLVETNPVIAYEDENLQEAIQKMGQFNHIPVLNRKGQFKGVLSKIKAYEQIIELKKDIREMTVNQIMVECKPIHLDYSLDDLIKRLQNSKFLFLPVTNKENDNFIGIIPNKEILMLFENAIGAQKEGQTIEIISYDTKGVLHRITRILKKEDVNIISINVLDPEIMGLRKIYLKVQANEEEIERIKNSLKDVGLNTM